MLTWKQLQDLALGEKKKNFLGLLMKPEPIFRTVGDFVNRYCLDKSVANKPLTASQISALLVLLESFPENCSTLIRGTLNHLSLGQFEDYVKFAFSDTEQKLSDGMTGHKNLKWYHYLKGRISIDDRRKMLGFLDASLRKTMALEFFPEAEISHIVKTEKRKEFSHLVIQEKLWGMNQLYVIFEKEEKPDAELSSYLSAADSSQNVLFLQELLTRNTKPEMHLFTLQKFMNYLARGQHVAFVNALIESGSQKLLFEACTQVLSGKVELYVSETEKFSATHLHLFFAKLLAGGQYKLPAESKEDLVNLKAIAEGFDRTVFQFSDAVLLRAFNALISALEDVTLSFIEKSVVLKGSSKEIDSFTTAWSNFLNRRWINRERTAAGELQHLVSRLMEIEGTQSAAKEWMECLLCVYKLKEANVSLVVLEKRKELEGQRDAQKEQERREEISSLTSRILSGQQLSVSEQRLKELHPDEPAHDIKLRYSRLGASIFDARDKGEAQAALAVQAVLRDEAVKLTVR